MCPLIKVLEAEADIRTTVAVTGQHREMLDEVLQFFHVVPAFDLNLFRHGATLSEVNARILMHVASLLKAVSPDLVLVHGDTATAFASAIAAFFQRIPIGHVEAGLRTERIDLPFPEEFHRRVISMISALDFAPTLRAKEHLLSMGKKRVFLTGNTVIDALGYTCSENFTHPILSRAGDRRLILCTAHRRESIGKPMEAIFRSIRCIAEMHPNVYIVCPLHKNPLIRACAEKILMKNPCTNIELSAPLSVLDCHNLLKRSYMILTDSGGLQEEASAFGVPVLILRETTERQELAECGGILCGCDEEQILIQAQRLLRDEKLYRQYAKKQTLYGDGHASEKIRDRILEFFSEENRGG